MDCPCTARWRNLSPLRGRARIAKGWSSGSPHRRAVGSATSSKDSLRSMRCLPIPMAGTLWWSRAARRTSSMQKVTTSSGTSTHRSSRSSLCPRMATSSSVTAFGSKRWALTGTAWRSRRISWDGMRNVSLTGTVVRGEAYAPEGPDGMWYPFEVDALTGVVSGGSYNGPPM